MLRRIFWARVAIAYHLAPAAPQLATRLHPLHLLYARGER